MTTPDNNSSVPTLDYQRARKAKRFATRGLLYMGIALLALGALLIISELTFLIRHGTLLRHGIRLDQLLFFAIFLAGLAYVTCAILIYLSFRSAAKIALLLTSAHVILWLIFAYNMFQQEVLDNPFDTLPRKVFFAILLFAITLGTLALPVEILKSLRNEGAWESN